MAGIVLRLLPLDVDVRADDSVEISPADNNADDDTAFVNAFDVVAGPGQGVWNGRVNLESEVSIKSEWQRNLLLRVHLPLLHPKMYLRTG